MSKKTAHYFKLDGKAINKSFSKPNEYIDTLVNIDEVDKQIKKEDSRIRNLFFLNFLKNCKTLLIRIDKLNTPLVRNAAIFAFTVVLIFSSLFAFATQRVQRGRYLTEYSIFSSRPLVVGEISARFYGNDSRSTTLNKVLAMYNCPLSGLGDTFVEEADKNNVPYWLVASVAFQESNCGHKTPRVDGAESYNAWGWGIWGSNVHVFDCDDSNKWKCGVRTVSRYFGNKFYSQGITNTCDIMKIYTPPSSGSWCKGVDYFADVIKRTESSN